LIDNFKAHILHGIESRCEISKHFKWLLKW